MNVTVSVSLAAVLSSESVTVQVHGTSADTAAGLPLNRLPDRVTPGGRQSDSEYDKSPLPPLPFGNSNGAIDWSTNHARFETVSPLNDGAVSGSDGGSTSTVNVNVSVSLAAVLSSESFTVQVHGTSANTATGLPRSHLPTRVTPSGRQSDNVCDKRPLPPLPSATRPA